MSLVVERLTGVQLRWELDDTHEWLAPVAFVGLVIAGMLAGVGLPPVSIHGPLHFVGIMDPLCGMTRGVAATLRGQLGTAVGFNPLSPLVPVGGLASLIRWVHGRAGRGWLAVRYTRRPVPVGLAVVALVALEVNQQLHADQLAG